MHTFRGRMHTLRGGMHILRGWYAHFEMVGCTLYGVGCTLWGVGCTLWEGQMHTLGGRMHTLRWENYFGRWGNYFSWWKKRKLLLLALRAERERKKFSPPGLVSTRKSILGWLAKDWHKIIIYNIYNNNINYISRTGHHLKIQLGSSEDPSVNKHKQNLLN